MNHAVLVQEEGSVLKDHQPARNALLESTETNLLLRVEFALPENIRQKDLRCALLVMLGIKTIKKNKQLVIRNALRESSHKLVHMCAVIVKLVGIPAMGHRLVNRVRLVNILVRLPRVVSPVLQVNFQRINVLVFLRELRLLDSYFLFLVQLERSTIVGWRGCLQVA